MVGLTFPFGAPIIIRRLTKYLKGSDEMHMNDAFKALADPSRRQILKLLRQGEMTAGELAEHFDMAKPSLSHHFSVLKQADLISARRDGQQIYYALNTTVVEDLLAMVWDLFPDTGTKQESKS
jgi:ArsR family transcriptional regulator, arsenate/arsenite/antimonite-responsive transcriptional repressor